MHKTLLGMSLFLLLIGLAHGQEKDKIVNDTWNAAYIEGARSGYFHSTTRQSERDGQKVFTTNMEMDLQLKRYGEVINLRMETGDEETADGKVLGVSLIQYLDKNGKQVFKGRIKDDKLLLRIGANPLERTFPWNPEVVGMYKQEQLSKERKLKPGDTYEFLNYELSLLAAVKVQVLAKDFEEVDVLDVVNPNAPKPAVERIKKKLLRVEIRHGKVKVGGNEIQLPGLTSWVDDSYESIRSQIELPGMGQVTLYRATEAVARQKPNPELMPDLGLNSLIKLDKPLGRVHDAKEAVYRITVKGDDDPTTIFVQDARQRVQNHKDHTFDLQVKAVRQPDEKEQPGEPKAEFLKSSFFLDSDSPKIKELAGKIVGDEIDPWKKAQRIEKWVHEHMKGDNSLGYVTASQIARDLRGDCRQHGMLTAALCRAAGIPARTALGVVYGQDPKQGPVMGFHLWTEVWIKGQWLALDATLGRGSIGAGHLKITDHSWTDTQTLAPLLPVVRAIGKIKVESVTVE